MFHHLTGALLVAQLVAMGCAPTPARDTNAVSPTPARESAPQEVSPAAAAAGEEYAVYTTAIESMIAGPNKKRVIVADQTVYQDGNTPVSEEFRRLPSLTGAMPKLTSLASETVSNAASVNTRSYQIYAQLTLSVSYTLVTSREIDEVFPRAYPDRYITGWKRFFAKYSDADRLISLSRVGFNSSMSQALVFLSQSSGFNAAKSLIFFLTKEGGAWSIQEAVATQEA